MDEFAYTYGYSDTNWKDLLTSYRGQTITYDAAGNPLSYYNGQSYTFTWEDGNQLASATVGGKTISFDYNSDGIRTKKSISGSATYYYRLSGTKVVEMQKEGVNGSYRYVFLYDDQGNPHALYYYSGSSTTPTKYYYVLNLQGDVVQLRNSSYAVVANYTYDAWGRLISVKNASGATISDASHIANVNPIRYRGYFYDTETKLYYCNSRYYDPQIKRFINADEYLSTGTGFLGYNMFAYCENNPVMYSDPNGYSWLLDCLDTTIETVRSIASFVNNIIKHVSNYLSPENQVVVFSNSPPDWQNSSEIMGENMAYAANANSSYVENVYTDSFSSIWENTEANYAIIHTHGSPVCLAGEGFYFHINNSPQLPSNDNIKLLMITACSVGGYNEGNDNLGQILSTKINPNGYVICATGTVNGGADDFTPKNGKWVVYQNGRLIPNNLPKKLTMGNAVEFYKYGKFR